jgi:hypothetical protein
MSNAQAMIKPAIKNREDFFIYFSCAGLHHSDERGDPGND